MKSVWIATVAIVASCATDRSNRTDVESPASTQPPAAGVAATPESTGPVAQRPAPPLVGGGPPADDRLQRRIAEATCVRAQRCGGVGPLGAFSSRQECVAYFIDAEIDEMGLAECGNVVDEEALSGCEAALRQQSCDDMSTPIACRAAILCGE